MRAGSMGSSRNASTRARGGASRSRIESGRRELTLPFQKKATIGGQQVSQTSTAIAQTRTDGQLVAAYDARDLGDAQLFEVVKDHHGPMTLAQLVERPLKASSALSTLQRRAGQGLVSGRRIALLLQSKADAPATVPAPVLQQNSIANGVNPSGKVAAPFELVATLDDLLGCLLHQIVQVRRGPTCQRRHAAVQGFE